MPILHKNGEITTQSFPQWKTWWNVHLDVNPWSFIDDNDSGLKIIEKMKYKNISNFICENNELGKYSDELLHVQGLVNFRDNRENDGGIQVVPGFSNYFKEWTESKQALKKRFGCQEQLLLLYLLMNLLLIMHNVLLLLLVVLLFGIKKQFMDLHQILVLFLGLYFVLIKLFFT